MKREYVAHGIVYALAGIPVLLLLEFGEQGSLARVPETMAAAAWWQWLLLMFLLPLAGFGGCLVLFLGALPFMAPFMERRYGRGWMRR